MRDHIIDDLTDVLDELGVETASYLSAVVAEAGPAALLPAGGGGVGGGDGRIARTPPKAIRDLVRRVDVLTQSPSVANLVGGVPGGAMAPQRAWPLLQELLLAASARPDVQRVLLETATHMLQRISTRAIRFLFFMPQPPARDLPRLPRTQRRNPTDGRTAEGMEGGMSGGRSGGRQGPK